ncbi:MAG: GGDEF domain-containing protein [Vibrio gallaecicus]
MKTRLLEMAINETEMVRRQSLIQLTDEDLSILEQRLNLLSLNTIDLAEHTVEKLTSLTVSKVMFKRVKGELNVLVSRLLNTLCTLNFNIDYLYTRADISQFLVTHEISVIDLTLCLHNTYSHIAERLHLSLVEDNLDPTPTLAAWNKRVLLETQLLSEMFHYLHQLNGNSHLKAQPLRDELTGVYNKPAFIDELDRTIALCDRSNDSLTILHIDFHALAKINDRLGYEVGNAVLQQFTNICAEQLRKTETIARDGGEFFILLPCTPIKNIPIICERIIQRFEETVETQTTLRIGACAYSPQGDITLEQLLCCAETHLKYAKERSLITDNHEFSLGTKKTTNNVLRLIK